MLTRSALPFVVIVFACGQVFADDSSLARNLNSTIETIAKRASKANHESILVIVRQDANSRSEKNEAILSSIEGELIKLLKKGGLQGKVSAKIQKLLGNTAKTLMQTTDVRQLEQFDEFDAVLTADYKQIGRRITLRIALIDGKKRHFVTIVKLLEKPSTKKKKTDDPTSTSTTKHDRAPEELGTATRIGVAPPISESFSGHRERRKASDVVRIGSRRRVSGNLKAGGRKTGERRGDKSKDGTSTQDGKDRDKANDKGTGRGSRATNRKVVDFSVSQIGKKVGNGQCWTLAAEALAAAGAQPPNLYDFGDEMEIGQIKAGDILHFKSARFEEKNYYAIFGTPDHVAVVYSTEGGKTFIMHQNFGKKIVTVMDINFDNMVRGTIRAFRPIPKR